MLALTFNVNRGPKTRPSRVEDFHPFRKRKRRGMTVAELRASRGRIEAIAAAMK